MSVTTTTATTTLTTMIGSCASVVNANKQAAAGMILREAETTRKL